MLCLCLCIRKREYGYVDNSTSAVFVEPTNGATEIRVLRTQFNTSKVYKSALLPPFSTWGPQQWHLTRSISILTWTWSINNKSTCKEKYIDILPVYVFIGLFDWALNLLKIRGAARAEDPVQVLDPIRFITENKYLNTQCSYFFKKT